MSYRGHPGFHPGDTGPGGKLVSQGTLFPVRYCRPQRALRVFFAGLTGEQVHLQESQLTFINGRSQASLLVTKDTMVAYIPCPGPADDVAGEMGV